MKFSDITSKVTTFTQRSIAKVKNMGSGSTNDNSFEQKIQQSRSMGGKLATDKVNKRTKPLSEWTWKVPWLAVGIGLPLFFILVLQFLWASVNPAGFFSIGAFAPLQVIGLIAMPIVLAITYKKFHAIWYNNNLEHINDMEVYEDDSNVRDISRITQEFDIAPDAGLGYEAPTGGDGKGAPPAALVSHVMLENTGIKQIEMPAFDSDVDGFIKRDENGDIVWERGDMFDKKFGQKLFAMSGVPLDEQAWMNATLYDYNRKLPADKGGGRAGAYGRDEYDTVADAINGKFFAMDTEVQRPAGIYFTETRPMNTILLAITRGGKGQTYIEPFIDVYTRCKVKWNLIFTDPKGGAPRSVLKRYSTALMRWRTNNLLLGMMG